MRRRTTALVATKRRPAPPPPRTLRPEILRFVAGIIGGMRPSDVARQTAAEFKISERQAHRYIVAIRDEMATEAEAHKPYHVHYVRQSLRQIMQRALLTEQLGVAVAAVDRIAKLDGLYAETRVQVEHSGSVDVKLHSMTRDERRARLAHLFDAYAAAAGDDGEVPPEPPPPPEPEVPRGVAAEPN